MLFFNNSLYCKKGLSHMHHGNCSPFTLSYIIEVKEALYECKSVRESEWFMVLIFSLDPMGPSGQIIHMVK
jgi:hypothetical protein